VLNTSEWQTLNKFLPFDTVIYIEEKRLSITKSIGLSTLQKIIINSYLKYIYLSTAVKCISTEVTCTFLILSTIVYGFMHSNISTDDRGLQQRILIILQSSASYS